MKVGDKIVCIKSELNDALINDSNTFKIRGIVGNHISVDVFISGNLIGIYGYLIKHEPEYVYGRSCRLFSDYFINLKTNRKLKLQKINESR